MHKGFFVSFEGVEGAGKTTQIALLKAELERGGRQVFVTREPGGDPIGEAIRAVLLDAVHPVTSRAELLLFMASRAQMVERVLAPHLEAGEIVLCDRYTDSSVVYQGYARGLDLDSIRTLNTFATGGLTPALTFVLDLPAAVGLERQTDRNRMEAESLAFHEAVRNGYISEAKREPERFKLIDAGRSVEAVSADILSYVREALTALEGELI